MRHASAAWRANNQIALGIALGVVCRVMIPPRRGKSIFLPTITLLPCLGVLAVMLPLFPRALPWAGGSMPLSGAHLAVRLEDCDTTEGMSLLSDYVFCCNGMKLCWAVRFCVVLQRKKMPIGIRQW